MGAMWFGRNQKFRWNHSDSPRVLQDLPGFNMDPHLDNRAVFGVVIVNLKDNPAGSGTTILDQFRKKQIYQGPTEKGTGILLFNKNGTDFVAFDKLCPNNDCTSAMTFKNRLLHCSCDESEYSVDFGGAPQTEGFECPAIEYRVTKIGTTIRISNF